MPECKLGATTKSQAINIATTPEYLIISITYLYYHY
jgi:hypothetical protein